MLILASEQEAVCNTKLLQNNMTYSKEQSKKQALMGTEVELRSEEKYQSWQSAYNHFMAPRAIFQHRFLRSLFVVNTEMIWYQR